MATKQKLIITGGRAAPLPRHVLCRLTAETPPRGGPEPRGRLTDGQIAIITRGVVQQHAFDAAPDKVRYLEAQGRFDAAAAAARLLALPTRAAASVDRP